MSLEWNRWNFSVLWVVVWKNWVLAIQGFCKWLGEKSMLFKKGSNKEDWVTDGERTWTSYPGCRQTWVLSEADREGLHPARVLWSPLAVQNIGVQVGRFRYLWDFAAGRVLSFGMPGSKRIMLNWKNLVETWQRFRIKERAQAKTLRERSDVISVLETDLGIREF